MPGYFEALGIPLLAGRDLEWSDAYERRPVVVVAESFARTYWDDPRAALGRRIANINIENAQDLRWHEIVGVVGDVHDDGLDQETTQAVYWPIARADPYGMGLEYRRNLAFVVRAGGGGAVPAGLLAQVQDAVWSVRSDVPLAQVQTMGELVERSLARTSFTLVMLGIAGAVALLLGAVGIYGVISYTVSQRTREIGVRMALGAERADVRRMVVGQGMLLTGVGLAVGLVAAFALSRLMASLLYGVEPLDVPTYAVVALALTAVATLATWLPARRASSVDPLQALRAE
jgi:predicted permease